MEPETNLKFNEGKEKLKDNQKFNFHLLSLNKIDYEITLELGKESIIIYACSQEKNKNIKNYYKEEFTIQYLSQYFDENILIEKYYDEIKTTISKSEKKGIVNELNNKIEIIIYMNSPMKNEISFILKKIEKSVDEKIGELYDLINNLYKEKEEQKKEIDKLKEKLETFTNQEIHIFGQEGKEKGTLIEISAFDESKFKVLMDEELKDDKFYFRFLIKFDNIEEENIIKFRDLLNEELKKEKILISIKNDSIVFDGNDEFNPESPEFGNRETAINILKNFFNINDLFNININMKTDLTIKDILEINSSKEIFNIFFKLKIIIKGLTLNFKLWLKSILNEIIEYKQIINNLKEKHLNFNQLYRYLNVAFNNRMTTYYFKENNIEEIYKSIKFDDQALKQIQSDLKSKFDSFIKSKATNNDIKVLKAVDFENILMFIVVPALKIGFKFNINLNHLNQVLKEEIFDKIENKEIKEEDKKEIKIEKKKENKNKIKSKSKTTIEEKKTKKSEKKEIKGQEIIKDDELDKIKEFRDTFELREEEYSNSVLIKILRKHNYNFENSFASLFDN